MSRRSLWSRAASRIAATVSIVAVCLVSPAEAMRVSPMVVELVTTGVGSAARIEVGNIGGEALPFETRITELTAGPDGEFVEVPGDDNFLVFPPQGLVPVGGRQVVRVQWVGEPELETSRAYYLWVRQLPVSTDVERPAVEDSVAVSVKVLYTMKALIVVAPPGARPEVEVVSVRTVDVTPPAPEIDPALTEGEEAVAPPSTHGVEVVVRNVGKRYALMSGATWIFEGTGLDGQPLSQTLTSGDISGSVGVGYLAPGGGVRTFQLPTAIPFDPARPVTVRFAR